MLQYHGCFHDLLQREPDDSQREGVMVERHTWEEIGSEIAALEAFGTVRKTIGTPQDIVEALLASKYYVQATERKRWGNGIIEAMAGGCLAIWNGYGYHSALFTPLTTVGRFRRPGTYQEVVDRVAFFEEHPELYQQELNRQRSMVNHLCYNRPLTELFNKVAEKRGL
jgi:hypothetical protein